MAIAQKRASGVRTQEINLSQVITSASSAVACLVLISKQGRTDPMPFTNADDFKAEYGDPDPTVSFDVYCALNFFKEGNQLWARRAVHNDALTAGVLMYANAANTTTSLLSLTTGVTNPNNPDWDSLKNAPTDNAIALIYPKRGPGSYAKNISVDVKSNNLTSPTNLAANSSATGGVLPAATYQYQIAAIGKSGETLATAPATVTIIGASVVNSVVLSWDNVPLAIGYRIYGRTAGSVGLIVEVGQGTTTFTDTGSIVVDSTKPPITSSADLPPPDTSFTINVYDMAVNKTTPVESFVCTLENGIDGMGTATELEQRINPYSSYIGISSNVDMLTDVPAITSTSKAALTGGDSGSAPTAYDLAGAFDVFKNKQLYQINLMMNSGHSNPIVQLAMDTICQNRGDAVALLDVPSDKQDFQSAINYRNLTLNLNSTYSALFCPDQLEADKINGRSVYIPFSGWAAALCARTDRVANPSFSPAGLNRGLINVLKSRHTFDDGQQTELFKAQVNYTQTFVGEGTALWEQQTMSAKDSALSWLSVRRIVNVMKVSLYKFLLYSVHEPNDDFTGRQIVTTCSDYLKLLQDARAISGFSVVSDTTNNTNVMFNSGIRRVTVIIIPIIPIHEIELAVVISKQGVGFEEILRAANQ